MDSSGVDHDPLNRAHELVERAERICILTGAGVSTDSGIPDFRGPNGVWTKNPGAEKRATLQHYVADRTVRVEAWRRRVDNSDVNATPNVAHRALASFEQRGTLDTLITQNIDGLHHAAGSSPGRIIEIHGSVREVVCLDCGDRNPMSHALDRVRGGEEDPPCQVCGGMLKSATISFGQSLVAEDLMRAEAAALRCDLMVAIGTTLGVYPIAGVVPVAARNGAEVVIVNGDPTDMDELADVVVRGSIGEIVPSMFRV